MNKVIILFAFCFFSLSSFAQDKEIIDKIVGLVGNELVLLSEVEEQYALIKEQQSGNLPEDARCGILESLLGQGLLLHQAKLDSIEVADEEVEAQLNARIDQILAYMNGSVEQFEQYYGQSISDVKESFRGDLKNQLLTERMRQSILSGITVTPSEVKSFFNKIPTDSLPYFNSEVEIKEIVYKPKINNEERQKAIDKLQGLKARIEAGEKFEELATIHSDDTGSAQVGGDLGVQKRGTFVPEFEAAAYSLEENEISSIVESEFGFHLIQLINRKGNSIHARHILVRPEITYNDLALAKGKLDSIRNLVMLDSMSFSFAVKRFSNEDEQSYNNDGNMVNPKTGNTFFETGDLDPDIYFTIDSMEVGDVSAPFQFNTRSGEKHFRIIQLQSRTVPHKANLQQDYNKIQKASLESKKGQYISDWVVKKINSTYINVDASYNTCPNLQKWREETRP